MEEFEIIILIISGIASLICFFAWYREIFSAWPPCRGKVVKVTLGLLPVIASGIIAATLKTLAASDVVDSPVYILFYWVLGLAWLAFGGYFACYFLDLHWREDVLQLNNKAALCAFSGVFLGSAIVYSGANIGEGPGWWCVLVAGGLGMAAWVALAVLVNVATHASERITVERDIGCGFRFGFYLLASAVILGRASSGDWTSFEMTVVEFGIGWPAIPLALLAIGAEWMFAKKSHA